MGEESQAITKPMEPPKDMNRNPTGKGGLGERPQDINTTGLNKGSEWQSTKIKRALQKIADANKITPEEVEDILFTKGYSMAKDGQFQFWNVIMQYIHGKPVLPIEAKVSGEIEGAKELAAMMQQLDDEEVPQQGTTDSIEVL
jgi:hypothetical protein